MSHKKWFRFVDDVFSIIKKHAITDFHNLLNSIDPHINFTIEQEQNGQFSFLDTIVTRNNRSLIINVYSKPTHTDRYLDHNSHHDKQHKVSTAQTLLHRAAYLPNTNEGKQQERNHVFEALRINGYPKISLDKVEKRRVKKTEFVPSPEELARIFFENVEQESNSSYAVHPYINGLTEPLKRLLKRSGIRTATKALRTLEQHFRQTDIVYNKINCADCSWSYIGETGRALETRKKEHIRNVKQFKPGSNMAKHAWTQDHKINFDECKILDKATCPHRTTLESWHTATTLNSDNNAQHLPEQYRFLLKGNRL